MHKIGTSLTFEAAHQLEKGCFTQKCSDVIHGHSYKAEIEISCMVLDANRMVIDFGELKEWKKMVDDRFDHALILPKSKKDIYWPLIERGELRNEKVVFLPHNPTAETLAETLFESLVWWLSWNSPMGSNRDLCVEYVRVWETANSHAIYRGSGYLRDPKGVDKQ